MERKNKIQSIQQKLQALNSSFTIQAGHPKALYLSEHKFEKAHEVFPNLFSENDERAILIWNKLPVLFSYTYGCYSNYDHLMKWFTQLAFRSVGTYELTLITEDFLAEIEAEWKDNIVKIKSNWLARKSQTAMAQKLNEAGMIRVQRMSFLREWKIILHQITNAFKAAKVELTDAQERTTFSNIYKLIGAIEGQGKLYTV